MLASNGTRASVLENQLEQILLCQNLRWVRQFTSLKVSGQLVHLHAYGPYYRVEASIHGKISKVEAMHTVSGVAPI